MSGSRLLRPLSGTLSTMTTTTQYLMSDQVVPIEAASALDFDMRLSDLTGLVQCKPCIQLIPVRLDNPDDDAAITDGSYTSTEGRTHYRETSIGGGSKALARWGIAYQLSSGSALGATQFHLQPALHDDVEMLGSTRVLVHPGMVTATDLNYAVISSWLPAVGISKVKAWFIVTENLSDYLEYQLILRSANDIRSPNTWQTVETTAANPTTTNTERNTGELSAPAGANLDTHMYFQLGVAFRKDASAGGNPRASILASAMVIRG